MSKISGTTVQLYFGGKAVAMQKGLNLSINDSIIDGSNKESLGWFEGIGGEKDAKIDFTSLFSTGLLTDTPSVLGAKDTIGYLLSRERLLMSILDIGYPIVGEVNMSTLTLDAPKESGMGMTGSCKVLGKLYPLANIGGLPVNLITDPNGNTSDYDALTHSGISITSAIKSTAGAKKCDTNTISVGNGVAYKLAVYLTLNSGQAPTVGIWDNTSAYISNTQLLVAGLNFVTLTSTSTDASASLRFSNSSNGNWSTSPIYLFAA
jgi:hypothetical protein